MIEYSLPQQSEILEFEFVTSIELLFYLNNVFIKSKVSKIGILFVFFPNDLKEFTGLYTFSSYIYIFIS